MELSFLENSNSDREYEEELKRRQNYECKMFWQVNSLLLCIGYPCIFISSFLDSSQTKSNCLLYECKNDVTVYLLLTLGILINLFVLAMFYFSNISNKIKNLYIIFMYIMKLVIFATFIHLSYEIYITEYNYNYLYKSIFIAAFYTTEVILTIIVVVIIVCSGYTI